MYPFLRMAKEFARIRRLGPIDPFETHITHLRCWPWDLDPWMELNNGRTLTLLDLGRVPFFARSGIARAIHAQGWRFTVAGSSVRYRKRITNFARLTLATRLAGWDAKFFYVDQAIWLGGQAATAGLFRMAVTDGSGLVRMDRVAPAVFGDRPAPPLPDWIAAWAAADDSRPWPPTARPG